MRGKTSGGYSGKIQTIVSILANTFLNVSLPSRTSSRKKLYRSVSIAKGPTFRPQNLKGAAKKSEGPEKLAAEFLPNFPKKGRKGADFFQTSCLRVNLWLFRDKCIFIPTLPSHSSTICKFFRPKTSFHVGPNFFPRGRIFTKI
jgi:hypothetical protein